MMTLLFSMEIHVTNMQSYKIPYKFAFMFQCIKRVLNVKELFQMTHLIYRKQTKTFMFAKKMGHNVRKCTFGQIF